MLMLVVQ